MFLTSLPKLRNIENRLAAMQSDLQKLSVFTADLNIPEDITLASMNLLNESAKQRYDMLAAKWAEYNISIPPFSNLEKQLTKVDEIIANLVIAKPELDNNLSVLLVPPTKTLRFPAPATLRQQQGSTSDIDALYANMPSVPTYRKWRVFVVYSAAEGLYLGTPKSILTDEKYVIGGLNTLRLGHIEYSALTLQLPHQIDKDCWTVLLRNHDGRQEVPCVSCIKGQYKFETEDINSVFGSDRFRPAVEVL